MEIAIPASAAEIIDKLSRHGYEAYVVGGCVRDMLLGREPEDWDITTSALPHQIKEIFRRTIDTGIQHGTVTVMIGGVGYEVTTYRVDGEYLDGRHPDSVSFTPDLREDLKRRDFTINAMAYNREKGIVDEFGGQEDLKAGVIRCVGHPMDRFSEDALRILRAIRFSAQLGFDIEENTYQAIGRIAPNLVHVSKERIQVELTKLLLSKHPEYIALVWEAGIRPFVFRELPRLWDGKILPSIPPVKHMRWAGFLRLESGENAVRVLKDLKVDNDTICKVKTLVTWAEIPLRQDKVHIRRVMSQMEPELFDDLLTLKMCLSQFEPGGIPVLVEEIRRDGDCICLKSLAVGGRDVMEAGVKPGKEVGACLSHLLDLVLENPSRNTREYLLKHLKS